MLFWKCWMLGCPGERGSGQDGYTSFPRKEAGRCRTTYVTQADILNQSRVHLRLGQHLLQQRVDEEIEFRVLEATLDGLGKGSAQGKSNDNIVRVLLSAAGITTSELKQPCVFSVPLHSRQSVAP